MTADETLFEALRARDYQAAEAAVAAGADINARVPGMRSSNLFHFFMVSHGLEQARWLFERGADIQAVDLMGDNALMRAIESNRREEFDAALEMGVDVDQVNDRGVSPVLRAALFEHGPYYLKRLLDAGANPSKASFVGATPLLAAAASGYLDMVQMLFAAGADPRGLDEDGQNIIYAAVMSGNAKVLQEVLEHTREYRKSGEIDVNHSASNHSEAIAKAALFSPEMTLMLLREGANPNAQSKNMLEPGLTPLMILAAFDEDGEASLVKEALAWGANPTLRANDGHNAFYYTFMKGLDGKRAVFEALIEAGLDPKAPVGPEGISPIHAALNYEQPTDETGQVVGPTPAQVVGAMLDLGFPSLPRAWVDPTKEKRPDPLPPPLVVALAIKDLDSAKVILEKGTPLNELDHQGLSVLHRMAPVSGMKQEDRMAVHIAKGQLAQSAGKKLSEKARQKAEQVAAEVEAMEAQGREVVAMAASWLSAHGGDWNVRGTKGVTPAMTMARAGGGWMLGQVVKFHGADLSLKDDLGRTAADHALESLSLEVFHGIVGHLMSSPTGLSPISGVWVQAVLQSPEVSSDDPKSFERRAAFVQALSTLPQVPEILEATDEHGNTPLILAAATGQEDLVSVLLAHGANPNAKNHEGETALLHAVAASQSDVVRLLRAAGADESLAATNGMVPRDALRSTDTRTRAALTDPDPADRPTLPLPPSLVEQVAVAQRAWSCLQPSTDGPSPRRRMAM